MREGKVHQRHMPLFVHKPMNLRFPKLIGPTLPGLGCFKWVMGCGLDRAVWGCIALHCMALANSQGVYAAPSYYELFLIQGIKMRSRHAQ
jgi:hypothetical protein